MLGNRQHRLSAAEQAGRRNRHCRWKLSAFAAALLTAAISWAGSPNVTLFFFCPEVNVNNHNALKSEFDTYLSAYGNYKFQPLSQSDNCEAMLTGETPGLFLMSSWQFNQLPNRQKLNPALVGVRDHTTLRRHGLYANKDLANLAALRGATIATAGTREYTIKLLSQMLSDEAEDLVASLHLLRVPKHVDALMAVSFGVADAAVASESAAARLSGINPKQMKGMKIVAHSQPMLLPVIVSPANPNGDITDILDVLLDMSDNEEGRRCLEMLGFDELQELEIEQKEELLK